MNLIGFSLIWLLDSWPKIGYSGMQSHIFPAASFSFWATKSTWGYKHLVHSRNSSSMRDLRCGLAGFAFIRLRRIEKLEASEELQSLSHRVFHQLKWLSRQYEPGYIEAFRQDFSTDWASYVAEAQEQLAQAIETSRRHAMASRRPGVIRSSTSTGLVRLAFTMCPRDDGLETKESQSGTRPGCSRRCPISR